VIVEISSRSARLELDSRQSLLGEMRLYVAWPVKLNNSIPLHLRVNARVVRTDHQYTVVAFSSYEFVTVGRNVTAPRSAQRRQRGRT
jgi:hypothetical protein